MGHRLYPDGDWNVRRFRPNLLLDIDANGVAYVGSTPRGSQWLDTRQHPDWVPEVQRLKTTEDLRQFFREKMATALSDKNTWISDFNKDGVLSPYEYGVGR